jgi:localization factor PodJL
MDALRQEVAQLSANNPSERVEALRMEVAALSRANPAERLEQIHRDVAHIALNNPSERLEHLGREVAHLAAQSRMSARNAEDRLEQIETSLREKARGTSGPAPDRATSPAKAAQAGATAEAVDRNSHAELETYLRYPEADDDYDSDMIAAAQRAARLADNSARTAAARTGPTRYQIPYGEFLPDDNSPTSRLGLMVAVVILLLAGAVMLFLKAKQWTLIEPQKPAAMLSETHNPSHAKQARLAPSEPTPSPVPAAVPAAAPAATGPMTTEIVPGKPTPVVTGSTPAAPPLSGRELQLWVAAKPEASAATEPQPEPAKPALSDESVREAAIKGNLSAQFSVGQNYLTGSEGEPNMSGDDRFVRAARWFRRAAEGGHAPSQYRLATLYELGQGTQRDFAEAEKWYLLAANQGHIKAMHNLAVLAVSGNKRSANYGTGTKWFREAASYGLVDSQYNLAILYERGMGVTKSLSEAYFWFALAARQQDTNAVHKRDEIGAKFLPNERSRLDGIIADWTPKARNSEVNRIAQEPPLTLPEDRAPAPKPVATANSAVMRATWQPTAPQTVQRSGNAEMIAEAQRLLTQMGYKPGPVDGTTGPRTDAAVRSFQRRVGMAETGAVTQDLIVKMAFLPL